MAWTVETAKAAEAPMVPGLLDSLVARGFDPETCAMDRGYDVGPVYEACEAPRHPAHRAAQADGLRKGWQGRRASTGCGPSPGPMPSVGPASTGAPRPSAPRPACG